LLRAQLLHSLPCSEHDRAEAELETIEVSTLRITVTNIPKFEIVISAPLFILLKPLLVASTAL